MSQPVEIGDVLAGKYRVDRVLGRGGMGVVVAATHLQLEQRVAIKVLLRPDAPEQVGRFLREARACVRLRSEHVTRVFDVGELPDGRPYIVMELLDGKDLGDLLKGKGALPAPLVVEYILQACEAIAEAHAQGIVHRDIKPANLFLTHAADGSDCIKVLDFGISKIAEPGPGDALSRTASNLFLGSPLYMSPEQMRSARNADARSDIWSLGVVIYQLLTAQRPFDADSLGELLLQVCSVAPTPPRGHRPELPEGLEQVILRCLEKAPESRFSNVAEMALALAPFGTPTAQSLAERVARIVGAPVIPSAGAVIASAVTPTQDKAVSTAHSFAKSRATGRVARPSRIVGAGLAGAALVAAIAVVVARGPGAPSPADPAAAGPPSGAALVVPPAPPEQSAPAIAVAPPSAAPPPPSASAPAAPVESAGPAQPRPARPAAPPTSPAAPSPAPTGPPKKTFDMPLQ